MIILISLFICLSVSLLGDLRGVVLIPDKQDLLSGEELQKVDGVVVHELNPPGSLSELQRELEPLYLGKPWNKETLSNVKQGIYHFYQERRRPFIVITIPKQKKSSEVLQLVIKESKLGEVNVVGNKWTPSSRFTNYLKIQSGDPISTETLSNDINFMNRNPYRFVDLSYSPGQLENTTDLTLIVSDQRSYRFYVGFDNTGVPATGRQRVFAGFSWDQVFGLDHVFSYQYATNYDVQRYHSNIFQYLALLPNRSILNLFGGFSVVHAHLSFPSRHNKGTNTQGSVRYQIPLPPCSFYSQETKIGFDLKNTNNTVEFVDYTPVFGHTVNLSQFILGYLGRWERGRVLAEGEFDLVYSPGQWLPNQTDKDFSSLRPDAKNKWLYASAGFKFKAPLPYSYSCVFVLRGQISSQVLLPSEQLPLGGASSVRGYDTRQFNADTGVFANFEIHSPSFTVFHSRKPNRMYFLLFADAGWGLDKVAVPKVKPQEYLIGVGPGIRYSFGQYLTAQCDWGIKLHHMDAFTGGASMVHFSVIGSY